MFKICEGKGFQITFDNGWTVSVQFGPGNYCENRNESLSFYTDIDHRNAVSRDAEIAAWPERREGDKPCEGWYDFGGYGEGEDYYPEHVKGWVKPNELLAFLNEIANKPKVED